MNLDFSKKRKIRIARVDVRPYFVDQLIKLVADHYDFELTNDLDSDFVFHSCAGMNVLKYSGVRIFITGENVTPNFAVSDYAMAFEKLTFRDRYIWLPLFKTQGSDSHFTNPRPPAAQVLSGKSGFCAYVMSNTSHSDIQRTRIFDLLTKYKQVNSGGRWRNNVGGPVPDKHAFQSKHKFVIAFENCSHPGYLTEKFSDAAVANAIPIYWGDPEIGNIFNRKAFINCHDYSSLEEVVERVKLLDQNDELYLQMLSEPWFPDGTEPECLKSETYAAFLRNIFDQDPSEAFRRNRGRWGIKTEKALYEMYFRPLVHLFKQIRLAWRKLYHRIIPHRRRN